MVNNIILNLLRADASIVVNKSLARKIGLNEAIVYSELISKNYYYSEKEQLTEEGFFYCTVEDLENSTTFSKHQQSKAINKLVKLGLIEYKVAGLPARRYFKINDDLNLLVDLLNNKEKALQTIENDKKLKNLTTGSEKTELLEVKKVNRNNTNINNTEFNNISQSVMEKTEDRQTDLETEKETIIEQAEIDLYKGDHRKLLENTIERLLKAKFIKVNDNILSNNQIREQLNKLSINVCDFAFNKFRQAIAEKEIKNRAKYFEVLLLSCIEEYYANNILD